MLLVRDDRLLLARRHATGYEDGKLHVPAGHLEAGESLLDAVCREAYEELGIRIDPDHPQLVHVMHRQADGGRIAAFFLVADWSGDLRNAEPHKCGGLTWAPIDRLPADTVPYTREALRAFRAGDRLSLEGW